VGVWIPLLCGLATGYKYGDTSMLHAHPYGNVNVFLCEIMWIACERPKYTCVLLEITWKSHNTHILKNNYHMCMAKITRNEHKTTCDNASFTCESLNLHASVRNTQVCDLNVCVFHGWPCGIHIEPHVDDNLKYIITWSHLFKPLIKRFHMWTSCEKEYHVWTSYHAHVKTFALNGNIRIPIMCLLLKLWTMTKTLICVPKFHITLWLTTSFANNYFNG